MAIDQHPGISENQNLRKLHTFGLDFYCRYLSEVTFISELQSALSFAKESSHPFLILGGGSNLLPTKDFEGLVIRIANKGIELLEETSDTVLIGVEAGENWHQLVMQCLEQGWFGIENLSLIPGSVGAAPMQNIGAYGVEVRQVIEQVHYYDLESGSMKSLTNAECRFGYRESIFKQELKDKAVIWKVDFRLSKQPSTKMEYGDIKAVLDGKGIINPTPKDVSEVVIQIRQSKLPDPAQIGNAGSFFKNPVVDVAIYNVLKENYPEAPSYPAGEGLVKIPAGWLIEKAGWKGKTLGNYGVHDRQALVLVNYGGAKGSDIYQLAKDIQVDVLAKFSVELQMEVNLI
jgi:UDP-N-acetylmuramate dehydrogenase